MDSEVNKKNHSEREVQEFFEKLDLKTQEERKKFLFEVKENHESKKIEEVYVTRSGGSVKFEPELENTNAKLE